MPMHVAIICAILTVGSNGSPTPAPYDTIVIGLGASGTSAATTLAAAGKKVLALEAQDRVGGRVYTVPFGDGIVELGAEWIHGTQNSSVYELAIKNNITILPHDTLSRVYRSDGTYEHENELNDLIEYGLKVVNEPPETPEPLGEYISRRIREYIKTAHPTIANDEDLINEFLLLMDLIIDGYESSNSWNDVTTASSFEELEGHQAMSWHKYGYKTLFEILLNTYNNGTGYPNLDIKLNTEVTKIQWPQDPADNVVVTIKDGTQYTAKTAIVTVSLGVLKERYKHLFEPPLPTPKVNSIENLSIGVVDKIILRWKEVWWDIPTNGFMWKTADRNSVGESDRWVLWMEGLSAPLSINNTLTVWMNGDAAKLMETLPDDEVKTKVMGVIRKFMGSDRTIPDPVGMIRSSWYSNPYTRGSYTYDNIHTPQHPSARSDLAAPLFDTSGRPRLLFAGEATHSTHFSTVHGAVDSGRREAARLLQKH